MNCTHCEAHLADNARFCHRCGNATVDEAAKPPKIIDMAFVRTADRDGRNGKRGENASRGQIRFHYGHARHAREAVQIVERYLDSLGLQTQIIDEGDELVVQGHRKPNLLKRAFGLDQAITVILSVDGNDLKTVVGGAKWIDKATGATIALLYFWPALNTTSWGVYKQRQLFSHVEKEIDAFLSSCSARNA